MATFAGAVAGGEEDVARTSQGVELAPESELEKLANKLQLDQLRDIQGLVAGGPNAGDVTSATKAQRDLAGTLGELSQTGFLPTSEDIARTSDLSKDLFAPQRVGLEQAFKRQTTEAQQLSARLGRPVNDPILQARLRTGFLEQQERLSAAQGAFGTQLALAQPRERLGLQQAQAQVLSGLGTQALANRTALLGLGQQLAASERQFRLATATRTGETRTGGGLKGFLEGGIAGMGADLQALSTIASFGMGGGGSAFSNFSTGGGKAAGAGLNFNAGAPPASQQISQFQLPNFATFGQSAPGFGGQQSPFLLR